MTRARIAAAALAILAAALVALTGGPALADTTVQEQLRATHGLVVSGTLGGPGVVSAAATLEIQGAADVGLSLARGGPANTTDENFIAYFAKDANGTSRKTASFSSIWGNTNTTYSVVRYNAPYLDANGVGKDDLSIQQHGGRGVTLCGVGGADTPPSGGTLMVRCNTWLMGDVQLEQPLGLADGLGEPACKPGIAQLFVGTDHKPKMKMGNCTVYTLVTQ